MNETAGLSALRPSPQLKAPWSSLHSRAVTRTAILVARCALVAALYYFFVIVGMTLHFGSSTLSLIWPANALVISVLVLAPTRHWWAYLLAVIGGHLAGMAGYQPGASWLACQLVANISISCSCAVLLRRYKPGILYFETLREVLTFLTVGIALPGVITLLLIYPVIKLSSTEFLLAHGWSKDVSAVWTSRWLTNCVSITVFVPFFLLYVSRGKGLFRDVSWRRLAKGGALALLFVTLTAEAYGHVYHSGHMQPSLYLIPVPLLIWAAIRFGPIGAVIGMVALVSISAWQAYIGEGGFIQALSIDRVTAMQMGWMIVAVPLLCLAAVVRERNVATLASIESESRFSQLFEQATVGVYVGTLDGQLRNVNPAFCRFLNCKERDLLTQSPPAFSNADDVAKEKPWFDDLLAGRKESYHIEKRFVRSDGSQIWGYARVSLLKELAGDPPLVLGMVEDITERKLTENQLRQLTGKLIEAQEAERSHISRELHDDIGQQAAALVDDLSVLQRDLPNLDPKFAVEQAARLHELASTLASGIHQLSHELHSSRLQHLGLGPALKELSSRMRTLRPIHMELDVDRLPRRLTPAIALCFFRVAQEALNNVIRHSEAQNVRLEAELLGKSVRMRISDDGVGFDPTRAINSPGIGLTSMRERIRLIDGKLYVNSAPRAGTQILALATLPE